MSKLVLAGITAFFLSILSVNTSLAAKAPAAPAPKYTVSDGLMVATFDVPVTAKISSWKLHFEFKTQCENDHRIVLTSPRGQGIGLMERGLNRCSGRSTLFTSDNDSGNGAFVGSSAAGTWKLTFQDLDRNKYSGALTKFRLELKFASGETKSYVVVLKGLPKKVPNP